MSNFEPRDAAAGFSNEPVRIRPLPVRRQVEEKLKQMIMSGAFAPGEHLSDRVLCEQLGVSRTIVREAVRLLEAEGLVVVVPHRGPFVAFLSPEEAAQVYEVRAALEGLAGAGFAARASDAERQELKREFDGIAAYLHEADHGGVLEAKRRFYQVLLRGCGNDYLGRMLDQLLNRNTQLRATSLSVPGRLPDTVKEVGLIMAAIEARDPVKTQEACASHVRSAAVVALRVLAERERRAKGEPQPLTV